MFRQYSTRWSVAIFQLHTNSIQEERWKMISRHILQIRIRKPHILSCKVNSTDMPLECKRSQTAYCIMIWMSLLLFQRTTTMWILPDVLFGSRMLTIKAICCMMRMATQECARHLILVNIKALQ